ncbi:MAG: hypothetical protein HYY76_02790 [Acidobacteria bacterium]|nr:hypothetical protein [Acidobacteriota bacterium]
MRCRPVGLLLVFSALLSGSVVDEARAQGWSIDVSAGQVVYDPSSANAGTNNIMGTVRYDARRGAWVYGTAAAPLRTGDPLWGAFGTGGRFLPSGSASRRANLGLDLGAHGFLFRDALVEVTGRGVSIDAMPFVSLSSAAASLELRGGWRGQTLFYAGTTDNRGVFETGARAAYGVTARIEGDARWVHTSEDTCPFVGATFAYGGAPVQVWVQTGKWLHVNLDDVAWGGGISVALGRQAMLWTAVQQEAPDPLYWNLARRSWNVGVTRRLGRAAPPPPPAPRAAPGGVVIRVPASEAPGTSLSIAGDFNNWQPVPMQREGRDWVIRLPLSSGVYHYAFRSGEGDWFVPESIAGRRDDGMGGYVALLVVS